MYVFPTPQHSERCLNTVQLGISGGLADAYAGAKSRKSPTPFMPLLAWFIIFLSTFTMFCFFQMRRTYRMKKLSGWGYWLYVPCPEFIYVHRFQDSKLIIALLL